MSEQSANSQDSARYSWHSAPQPANAVSIGTTEIRAQVKHVCPECGERVHSPTDTCPACGEHLARAPKQIRCMHCHTQATSELVVCPGCGRELREAPPKLVTYGVPAVLALFLVVLVVTQWETISPIAWARSNLVRGVILVEGLSASIEPEMVIVMTPIVEEGAGNALAAAPAESIVVSETQAVAMVATENVATENVATESVVTPLPDANAGNGSENNDASILAAASSQKSPIGVGGPRPTDTAVAPVVEQSMATPVATSTPSPTDTPLPPTSTPTAEATEAKAAGMAAALSTSEPTRTPTPTWTVPATTASNERNAESAANESAGGMVQSAALAASETTLPTPTATPTVATTPLPTPTVTPVVYQVQAGDTLVTIASNYEVDVEALMLANEISAQEVFVIQPGQMLIVPVPTPTAEPVVATTAGLAAMRLGSPVLLMPPADATVGCATGGQLIWQRVQFVKDSDKYVLHLGFVNGQSGDGQSSDGQENVVWVLAQNQPVTQTEWELDTSLCDLAPDEFDRQWRWWVEVVEEVDGRTIPVSPPSEIRSFVWE